MKAPNGDYLITAGLFNLTDQTSAETAFNGVKPIIDAQKGRFVGMSVGPNTGTDAIVRAPTQLGWNFRGHFIAYCVIARTDGQAFAASDQFPNQITFDIVETYLEGTIIGKRATVPGATHPGCLTTGQVTARGHYFGMLCPQEGREATISGMLWPREGRDATTPGVVAGEVGLFRLFDGGSPRLGVPTRPHRPGRPRPPASGRARGATITSLDRSRGQQVGRPGRRAPAVADDQQRADQAAHHRLAERVGLHGGHARCRRGRGASPAG